MLLIGNPSTGAFSGASALSRRSFTRTSSRSLAALVNGFKPLEEPLHLSVDDGYGFARIKAGDTIGQQDRFSVVRRLGWGMYSSTWLAKDHQDEKHVAVKVLTGFATRLAHEGLTPELDVLRKLSTSPHGAEPKEGHCLSLHSNFLHPGRADTGPHLCLVTDVFGGDVEHLKRIYARNGFPLSLAKRILLHTLKGLTTMHQQGIVHTDLKHDNILFDGGNADLGSVDPLPVPSVNEALDRTFVIADFGNAQFVGKPTFDEITAEALRAPETLLRGPWDEKVDIWTFGCLAFEFLCGRQLFKKRSYSEHLLDTVGGHLWRMQCFTDEKFDVEQLKNSEKGYTYFDSSCQLKSRPPIFSHTVSKILANFNILDTEQLRTTASFLHRCLRLDPRNRASAEQLLDDPFWEGVHDGVSAEGA
ncbi:kinase-like protein [Lentinula aciculospora]|uniref:non-specific serine/threonine protein kinase n=1 Tax=Lentinula aciculospora TaxID=153920 RepID=A0A9W9AFU2_9AGAR|nr:kinase-like protein [Lentinula aciculospora]